MAPPTVKMGPPTSMNFIKTNVADMLRGIGVLEAAAEVSS